MIRIQLFRAGIPQPVKEETVLDEPAADKMIDHIITDVHQGTFGPGTFSLYAFASNDSGAHLQQYYAIERFTFPRESVQIP